MALFKRLTAIIGLAFILSGSVALFRGGLRGFEGFAHLAFGLALAASSALSERARRVLLGAYGLGQIALELYVLAYAPKAEEPFESIFFIALGGLAVWAAVRLPEKASVRA
jgi:hypothetical protein